MATVRGLWIAPPLNIFVKIWVNKQMRARASIVGKPFPPTQVQVETTLESV